MGDLNHPPWMEKANCIGMDPEFFFPPVGALSSWYQEEGLKLCAECDVRLVCLEYAISERIEDGTWGGKTAKERRQIVRKRRALRKAQGQ